MPYVGNGDLQYEPVPDWPRLPPDVPLVEAVGVATDAEDRVYIFNRGGPPVIVLSREGEFLATWGEGEFVRPHGLWLAADQALYLTDDLGHAVRQFSRDGMPMRNIGPSGQPSETGAVGFDHRIITAGGPPYHLPTNTVTAPNGDIYVVDGYGNARVHRFSAAGEYLASWGEPGGKPGEFRVPHGLGIDAEGRLYVADRENSRIQIFSPDGQFLTAWTDVIRPCEVFVAADGLVYVAELGAKTGMFPWMQPASGAVGGRISIFDMQGRLLSRWGNQDDPTQPDAMFAPHDIWVDTRGDIYLGEVSRSARPAPLQGLQDFPSLRKYRRRR